MARRVGMKDLTVAKVTKNSADEYVAEAPKKLMKAISAKVNVKKSSEKMYSDDDVEDIISALDSVEVEFEGDDLTSEMLMLLYGAKKKSGILVDNKDDKAEEVAIGWRAKRSNGKYEFIWLYCGKFGESDEDSYETQADKMKAQTKKIKGEFYPRLADGDYRARLFEEEILESDIDAKAALTKWFSEVPNQVTVTPKV